MRRCRKNSTGTPRLRATRLVGCEPGAPTRMRAAGGGGSTMTEGARWSGRPSAVTILAALVGYVGIVVWLTWPLAAHLGSHLPHTTFICEFDLRQMVWALSW